MRTCLPPNCTCPVWQAAQVMPAYTPLNWPVGTTVLAIPIGRPSGLFFGSSGSLISPNRSALAAELNSSCNPATSSAR